MSVLRAYRGLLTNGPLVRLLAGEFVSSIGDWLYLVALLVVVYQASTSPVLLGVVGAARVLPYVVLSIPAGIVADRYDRRLVLLVTDVARGVLMLGMSWLVAVRGPLPALIGLAITATCFSSFFGPTIGAYLPSLVRDERELGPANSAWSTLDNLAFVVGPAIGGLLIGLSGLALAFLLNAASFAVIAIVLWRLPPQRTPIEAAGNGAAVSGHKSTAPDQRPDADGGTPEDQPADPAGAPAAPGVPAASPAFGTAVRSVSRQLVGLGLADTAAGFVFGGLSVLTVVLAVDRLAAGEAGTGYLNAAVGVGGIIGALGAGFFVVRAGLRGPLVLGAIGLAVGVAALGLTRDLRPALAAMAVASAGSLLAEVTSTTIFQRVVPDAIRGRALGMVTTVSTLAYAAGSFALPVLAGRVGVEPVLVGSGVVVVVGVSIAALVVGPAADRGPTPELRSAAARAAALPIFAGVPEARLAGALARARELDVRAGDVLIRQGDRPDWFYVILAGRFRVDRRDTADGPAVELRRMGPDEVFGEIGLLTGVARTATVTAIADGRVLALDGPDFLELVTAGPELGPRLLGLHRGGLGAGG